MYILSKYLGLTICKEKTRSRDSSSRFCSFYKYLGVFQDFSEVFLKLLIIKILPDNIRDPGLVFPNTRGFSYNYVHIVVTIFHFYGHFI